MRVIAGAGDNAAGAVGTGTLEHGMCSVSLGTSGTVFIATDEFAVDAENAMHSFAHANGRYHFLGCMLSAASANKWWMDEIIGTKDYPKEQEGICRLGDNQVFFLPYLMGERTPHKFKMLATILHQSGLFAPPPFRRTRSIFTPKERVANGYH